MSKINREQYNCLSALPKRALNNSCTQYYNILLQKGIKKIRDRKSEPELKDLLRGVTSEGTK